MRWASSGGAEVRPGEHSQPSTAREGAKDHCSLVGAGRDWGQRGWTQGPQGGCHPRLLGGKPWEEAEPSHSRGRSSEEGSESTPPSAPALALVRPPPSRGRPGLRRASVVTGSWAARLASPPPGGDKEASAVPVPAASSYQGWQHVLSWRVLSPGRTGPRPCGYQSAQGGVHEHCAPPPHHS